MNPKAPPLADGDWLRSPAVTSAHLAGRVTIIVFFSIGNEASWVRLRQLEDLSADLGDTLAIVAVHSPRHRSERDVEAVDRLITRAGVPFPVVHDADLTTWARYSPAGWPATVVIDDRGRLVGISHGIEDLDVLFEAVTMAEGLAADRRRIDDERRRAHASSSGTGRVRPRLVPLPVPVPNRRSSDGGPSWPSGLCAVTDRRIAVADSGNDRVVVYELDDARRSGVARRIYHGLDRPAQVCTLPGGDLAVSEPSTGRVLRLTPDAANDPSAQHRVIASGFVRPRGLVVDRDGSLVVTDAGADRLFRVLPDGRVGAIAGNRRTGRVDGRAGEAELGQPVAVARSGPGLVFLDVATSSLRLLTDAGRVHTVSGDDDRRGLLDGPAESAALDGPCGLAALADGSILVADTGNHRLRLLVDQTMHTLGVVGLDRPEDVVEIDPGIVIVADTGNHRLVGVDVASHDVWPIELHEPDRRTRPTAGALVGAGGSRVAVGFPAAGPGPWTVTVQSSPGDLLDCPLRVLRSDPNEPVTVRLGRAGGGHLAVTSVGPDPATSRVQLRHLHVVDS